MTSIDHVFPTTNIIRNKEIGNRRSDPLLRLLAQLMDSAGVPAIVLRAASRPWASALFQGRRHVIALRVEGADAAARKARFVQGLETAEWIVPGHFVADIIIDDSRSEPDGEWLELSALTIEDW